MSLRPGELRIGDDNYQRHMDAVLDERRAKGLIPRDYVTHPRGCYRSAKAIDFPTVPRSEWPERIKDKIATKSQCSDIRLQGNAGAMIPSRDQDGKGYCWAHSSTSAVLVMRAANGDPYADLSAYCVACTIKGYRDEGGWGAQSLDFFMDKGCPTSAFWPQQSMSRSNDKPETWANALLHRVTAGFVDLAVPQYDRKLSFDQRATLMLCSVPTVDDFNWWSHSVCGLDLVDGNAQRDVSRSEDSGKLMTVEEFELAWGINDPVTGGFGTREWNSWGDSWSDRGMGVLTGSKAQADGCVAPRAVLPSLV